MLFLAHIVPTSAIHKTWSAQQRVSGLLDGVSFRWDGEKYASGELTSAQVESFRSRQDKAVKLEIARVLPREAQQAVLSAPPPAKPERPKKPEESVKKSEEPAEDPAQERKPAVRRVERTRLPE